MDTRQNIYVFFIVGLLYPISHTDYDDAQMGNSISHIPIRDRLMRA